jgi:hypothetical protein
MFLRSGLFLVITTLAYTVIFFDIDTTIDRICKIELSNVRLPQLIIHAICIF